MQGSSASDNAAQPPQVYRSKGEILACLRPAQQQHIPLRITFNRQGQQFQSFVVEIDEAKGLIALDEFIPREAERLLEQGQSFRVDSFHEGIKVTWQIDRPVEFSELDGNRCYWIGLPTELTYHQRRNAYRVKLLLTQPATIGAINTPVTIRHVACPDRLEYSDVGVCFDNLSGAAQRQIERFVYQLQRENRRFE